MSADNTHFRMPLPSQIQVGPGRYIDITAPRPSDITIDDIVLSLSRECRFGNFTRSFYSVAQHSVNVSAQIRATGGDREAQLIGLLHDAHEAYVGDVPTPHKLAYGDRFAHIEAALSLAVCTRFNVPAPSQWPALIHAADERLLHAEAKRLVPDCDWHDEAKAGVSSACDFEHWDERKARHKFLDLFYRLQPEVPKEHA